MKIVRFRLKHEEEARVGLLQDDGSIQAVSGNIFGPYEPTGRTVGPDEAILLAPCRPGKIIAIGLNYRDHAEEFKLDLPETPMLFMKPPTSVIAPGEPVVCPSMSKRVDYEAELAVVIKERARKVSREKALGYVLGYTCLNDVTARDLQAKDGQWIRAKGFDTFCPLGPAIVSGIDSSDLTVASYLNGELKQSSRTSNLVFGVAALIEFISSVMTLEPGDVIATGTPSGVGPMNPGDVIEIRIEGLGSLVNPVASE